MKKLGITQYVQMLTLTPLLIMATGMGTYFLLSRFADLDDNLQDRGRLIARQLASSSEYGVFAHNRAFLQNIVQGVLEQPDVRGVMIFDSSGNNLIEAGSLSSEHDDVAAENLPFLEPANRASVTKASEVEAMVSLQHPSYSRGDNLWIYQPIYPEQVSLDETSSAPVSPQIGSVILEMSWARTTHVKSRMAWITIGSAAAFLMITYLLVYLASRNIIFPIRKLSQSVRLIGGGQLDTRADTALPITELETLAVGVNDMAAKLEQENAILHQRMEDAVRLAAIAFESHEGMLITDPACMIIKVNDAFTRVTGYTEKDAIGNTPHMLASGHHDAAFYSAMWDTINSTGLWQGEIWNRRKSGEVYPAWVNITAIERDGKDIAYYVGTYTDITTRKAAENEIKQLAFNDALTKLPNRRMLVDLLNKAMTVSKRSRRYGALMFIDLDNFKPLNDQYGHESGDALLVEVARRLTISVREVDTVARFGGDEFVVMLNELDEDIAASMTQAGVVAEKIRVVLSERYVLKVVRDGSVHGTVEHHCTSSIGIDMFLGSETSAEEILKRADLAMYHAKRSGRNRYRFYEAT